MSIVPAVSLNEADYLFHAGSTAVCRFSSEALPESATRHRMSYSFVPSDGIARFRTVTAANCYHKDVVTGGKYPKPTAEFPPLHQPPTGQPQDRLTVS